MTDKEKLEQFFQSDFWQDVNKDAAFRASKREYWKEFDDPTKYFVAGAKESSRAVYVVWELDALMNAYSMDNNYDEIEHFSYKDELAQLRELQRRVTGNPVKYQAWKNG